MKKIIVPTDFSPTSAAALRYAYFLAEAIGLDLEVLHVHDGYGDGDSSSVNEGDMEAYITTQHSIDQFIYLNLKAEQRVTACREKETDVNISSWEIIGKPHDGLIAASHEEDTRLVVMGAVGTGAVSTMAPLFGSVARTVAKRADCPVLLVPKDYGAQVLRRASISFGAVSALRETSKGFDFISSALAPALRLVHIRDFSKEPEASEEAELTKDVVDTRFSGYPVALLDLLDPNVTAHQLLAHAHDDEIDLLVMGHYHKSLFERLFSGSKILPTLENINTPMLVIPIADD
jgi:nucleotide-binding universal stress UspA family protein